MSRYTLRDLRTALEARLAVKAPHVNGLRHPEDKAPLDPDGKVHPYWVMYLGVPYEDETQTSLCGEAGIDVAEWQMTLAGGDQDRVEFAVHHVQTALRGWAPLPGAAPIRGVSTGRPIEKDTTFTPPRWYVPALYRTALP